MELSPNSPIQYLKGVGQKRAELFSKLSIWDISDLLSLYPRAYEDLSVITPLEKAPFDEKCCVRARVTSGPESRKTRGGRQMFTFSACDCQTFLKIIIFNNIYAAKSLIPGKTYLFYGKVTGGFLSKEMISPEILPEEGNRIYAVYPQTAGLNSKYISKCIKTVLESLKGKISDPIPAEIREKYRLTDLETALWKVNFPKTKQEIETGRRRLIFGELLGFSLGMALFKKKEKTLTSVRMEKDFSDEFFKKLPFSPTGAQIKAAKEISRDMAKNTPMRRLLQGDVGSGKTAVAASALYTAFKNGWQAAFMAPTEILASQHFNSLKKLLGDQMNIALLTGSLTPKAKKEIYSSLKSGQIDLVIGTHALIQDKVVFKNLGLVISDEQHRFGVKQRSSLAEKGEKPHLLAMSATPIPRSLALIIYGDLDLSVLDEMPPGRTPVETYSVSSELLERAYGYVRRHLDSGKQGYIICPLVEEGDDSNLSSAEKLYEQLSQKEFRGYTVGLLHGKMRPKEKDAVMTDFAGGKIQLLISTTVVEVGVDVPNAVIMIIENAERFGLSQLHQLRGRVGRGKDKSTCILICDSKSDSAKQRMNIMCKTCDGFKIADEDLKMRGPGDFFGSRQHGLPIFKIADMVTDSELVSLSARAAKQLIQEDPSLQKPEHRDLKIQINKLFSSVQNGAIS